MIISRNKPCQNLIDKGSLKNTYIREYYFSFLTEYNVKECFNEDDSF